MYCPICKSEYRDEITRCSDCDCDLVENLPKEEPEFDPNKRPTCIYIASDEFEADIIISKLRAEGIYAFKRFRGTDDYNRILFGRTVLGVEVLVAQSDEENALEIIK